MFSPNKGFSHHLTFYSVALSWAILSTSQTIVETFELPLLNGTAGNMRDWHQFLGQMEVIKDSMANILLTDRIHVESILVSKWFIRTRYVISADIFSI